MTAAPAVLAIVVFMHRRARRVPGRPLDLPVKRIVAYDSEEHPGNYWCAHRASVGKPDVVLRYGQVLIPVELKSGSARKLPRP